jgi:hypothetical protein
MKSKIILFTLATITFAQLNSDSKNNYANPFKHYRSPASEIKEESKSQKTDNQVTCLSKNENAKVEEDVKKQLKDKEDVLKEIAALKSENEELKKKSEKPKAEIKANNEDVVSLLSQITNLLMSQQQAQLQLQNQMFSMMSMMPMNSNSMNMNPYALSYDYTSYHSSPYSYSYPSLNDTIGFYGSNIGIARQPSSQSMIAEPTFQTPQIRGYDFSLNGITPLQQPNLLQMQRSSIN